MKNIKSECSIETKNQFQALSCNLPCKDYEAELHHFESEDSTNSSSTDSRFLYSQEFKITRNNIVKLIKVKKRKFLKS